MNTQNVGYLIYIKKGNSHKIWSGGHNYGYTKNLV